MEEILTTSFSFEIWKNNIHTSKNPKTVALLNKQIQRNPTKPFSLTLNFFKVLLSHVFHIVQESNVLGFKRLFVVPLIHLNCVTDVLSVTFRYRPQTFNTLPLALKIKCRGDEFFIPSAHSQRQTDPGTKHLTRRTEKTIPLEKFRLLGADDQMEKHNKQENRSLETVYTGITGWQSFFQESLAVQLVTLPLGTITGPTQSKDGRLKTNTEHSYICVTPHLYYTTPVLHLTCVKSHLCYYISFMLFLTCITSPLSYMPHL